MQYILTVFLVTNVYGAPPRVTHVPAPYSTQESCISAGLAMKAAGEQSFKPKGWGSAEISFICTPRG